MGIEVTGPCRAVPGSGPRSREIVITCRVHRVLFQETVSQIGLFSGMGPAELEVRALRERADPIKEAFNNVDSDLVAF